MPLPVFSASCRVRRRRHSPRRGVSELYASLLMLGVTLSFGTVVAGLALSQFGVSSSSAAAGASQQAHRYGTQVSFLYATVSQPGSCPVYRGAPEGSTVAFEVYDYGSQPYTPAEASVNRTLYFTTLGTVSGGAMGSFTLPLHPGTCTHQTGLAVMLEDSNGDEVEFVT